MKSTCGEVKVFAGRLLKEKLCRPVPVELAIMICLEPHAGICWLATQLVAELVVTLVPTVVVVVVVLVRSPLQ